MPQWRRDGKELYYVAADGRLTAVPIRTGSSVETGLPQPLFTVPAIAGVADNAGGVWYAPSGDGQRFLVNVLANDDVGPAHSVVLNRQAGLKKYYGN